MRLAINLASQPYEVAQQYKRRLTIAISALACWPCCWLAISFISVRTRAASIVSWRLCRNKSYQLDNEESQARAILNKPAIA